MLLFTPLSTALTPQSCCEITAKQSKGSFTPGSSCCVMLRCLQRTRCEGALTRPRRNAPDWWRRWRICTRRRRSQSTKFHVVGPADVRHAHAVVQRWRRMSRERASSSAFTVDVVMFAVAQTGLIADMATARRGGHRIWPTNTRTPRPDGVRESRSQRIIHPVIDDRVPTTAAHRQPVAGDPDQLDVLELPDGRLEVSEHSDAVQRQPAQSVDDDHRYHRLHYLSTTPAAPSYLSYWRPWLAFYRK